VNAAVLTGLSEDGDRGGSEIVELLPAVEQLFESRVGVSVERAALAIMTGLRRIETETLQGRGIHILAKSRGESKLALLDQLHAALGLGGETSDLGGIIVRGNRNGRWGGRKGSRIHETGKSVARPGDERHQADEGGNLDIGGKAKTAQLGAVVDEKVAVPKQAGRRRQNCRHDPFAPKTTTVHAERRGPKSIDQGAPQPPLCRRNVPFTRWRGGRLPPDG